MTRLMTSLLSVAVFATLLAYAFSADSAQAQTRVFVAAQGSDSNPCTFAAPCRTFQHAHDVVLGNGEIDVLDPAGYGALTINKPISILGHGFSGITVTSGVAITITAGPTDFIKLNGLLIDGFGNGVNGIVFNTGGSLEIVDSSVRHFSNFGILLQAPSSRVSVVNSSFSDNGAAGVSTDMQIASSGLTATFNNVTTNNNGSGFIFNRTAIATTNVVSVIESASTNNTNAGFLQANSGTGLTLDHVAMYGNNIGVSAGHGGTRIGDSRAANKTFDIDCAGGSGSVTTFGDNRLALVNGTCVTTAARF